VSSRDIWVLGFHTILVDGAGGGGALFEHWDGQQWSLIPAAEPAVSTAGINQISYIAAGPAGEVWAVGRKVSSFHEGQESLGALAERWNGSQWVEVPAPDRATSLGPLAVVGPNDVWAVQSVPFDPALPNGDAVTQFVHWDGTGWIASTAADGVFSLAAKSANDIWAVGSGTVVQHWDGQQWVKLDTRAPAAATSGLKEVSIATTGAVVAFGGDVPTTVGGFYSGPPDRANNYLFIPCEDRPGN
jgi:hypothetical protein